MKNLMKFYFGPPLIIVVLLLVACNSSSDDSNSNSNNNNNNNNTTNNSAGSVIGIVNNGSWRITYFFDTDHEETSNFTGFNFTFGTGNTLTATNGTDSHVGTWSVTDSDGNYDYLTDLHFNIAFADPANFQELSEDWEIMSKSASSIQLKHVSGGGGGTDFLTFTKN